ncbi:MAG: hypothetical protein LBC60_05810 [Spirochaetaceae bacterium]|nr:hypothetical protein [Spirochaetaceae bacterium]
MIQTAELEVQEARALQPVLSQDTAEEFQSGKIYCANCIHCKLIPAKPDREDRYVLRIRCAAGKWKKKLGEEKMYKYCTITRRYLDNCDAYEEMGDTREFIRELRKNIPNRDEFYTLFEDKDEDD